MQNDGVVCIRKDLSYKLSKKNYDGEKKWHKW